MNTRSRDMEGEPVGGSGSVHDGSAVEGGRSGGVTRRLRRWWSSASQRRRVIWAVLSVGLLLLLVMIFRPNPLPVEMGQVVEGHLETTIDSEGVTRVVDRYEVAAPVAGRLQRITVMEGDRIAAGEVVARLTPVPLDPQSTSQARAGVAAAEARVTEATAGLQQAQEVMEQAQRHARRVQEVVAAGGLSAEAGEQAALQASQAEQQLVAAQARVRVANSDLAAAHATLLDVDPAGGEGRAVVNVTAPAAGRVLRVHERSERVVPAGTPLVAVGDAAGLEVVVDVLSTDAVRIMPGAPMRIQDWGGSHTLMGRVRSVEPSAFTEISALGVEEQRVNVIGDLFEAPPSLGDQYRVEASIVVWEADDVVKVPTSALFQTGTGWAVFLVEDGRAVQREIEIGQRGVTEAEVLLGLEPGDTVVLFPSDQLSDGAAVTSEESAAG